MKKQFLLALLFSTAILILLGACGGSAADPAGRTVERYVAAMVKSDTTQMAQLVCKDFEEQSSQDADSFQGVKAELKDASCVKSGTDGDVTLVSCSGKIAATYGSEQQTFDLAGPVYRVTQQDGNWLICGRQ